MLHFFRLVCLIYVLGARLYSQNPSNDYFLQHGGADGVQKNWRRNG